MWKILLAFFALLCRVSTLQEPPAHNASCPTWTHPSPSQDHCECTSTSLEVLCTTSTCNRTEVAVALGHCMTLDVHQRTEVVGPCLFTYGMPHTDLLYFVVPSHPSELDTAVCGFTNRTGQLCGQCVNGTSPPVYSYCLQCVNCTTSNWVRFLTVSLLPTTVFFLGAVAFRLRATAPHMNGYILICQIVASPPILRLIVYANTCHVYSGGTDYWYMMGELYISFLGIWNLDFFRIMYSPFCLHPNASTLQVYTLFGLYCSSLSSCSDHSHIHTSHPPLPQLQACGVSVEALPQVLHSLSKAVEDSELTCGYLCNLPPPVLCEVLKCLI